MRQILMSIIVPLMLSVGAPALMASDKTKGADITPAEAAKMVAEDKAILVDVREQDEVLETGLAEPSKWLSMEEIQTRGNRYESAIRTWPKSKPLIFYCVSGRRAGIAGKHFQTLGYTVRNMGGFKSWQEAGLPVRKKP
jgi:phage shock protein E